MDGHMTISKDMINFKWRVALSVNPADSYTPLFVW